MFDIHLRFLLVTGLVPVLGFLILKPHIFLYLGPDTLLPAASICGALVGFVLIFGRYILSMARNMIRKIKGQEELPTPEAMPEADSDIVNTEA